MAIIIYMIVLYETRFAKKTNNRLISGRKTPRLYADIRLQCVLSGNQVIYSVTIYQFIKGEPPFGNERFEYGENLLDL